MATISDFEYKELPEVGYAGKEPAVGYSRSDMWSDDKSWPHG